MLNCLAHIEAHIDFPEEDIAPDTKEQLVSRLQAGITFMDELLATANEGRLLRRGIRVGIIGRPNAGKSSLLNALLGHDRAIVSTIPGTTRDTIEETANIRGLPVVFIDTAGLREAGDEIELEGIRRSRKTLENAEMVLYVIDASEPLHESDHRYLAGAADGKRVLVLNKSDLPAKANLAESVSAEAVRVSCVTGEGIETLKDRIKQAVWAGNIEAPMLEVMINSRHQEALSRARSAATRCLQALSENATLELVAMDLRISVNAIGEIVGETTTEDLLDRIFSQFCIGK
jgi:tRNA modification GTPase